MIKGHIKVFENNVLIMDKHNLITTEGKNYALDLLRNASRGTISVAFDSGSGTSVTAAVSNAVLVTTTLEVTGKDVKLTYNLGYNVGNGRTFTRMALVEVVNGTIAKTLAIVTLSASIAKTQDNEYTGTWVWSIAEGTNSSVTEIVDGTSGGYPVYVISDDCEQLIV